MTESNFPEKDRFANKDKFDRALRQGQCDVVDDMLDRGYIPDPDSIILPCETGNVDLLLKLLKYPMNRQEALFRAVRNSHTHLLDHLYVAGVDVNYRDSYGHTALCCVNDIDTCKWLLDMGAQVSSFQLAHGTDSPFLRACVTKSIEIIQLMLTKDDGVQAIAQRGKENKTCLYWACFRGDIKIVELLLSYEQGIQTIPFADTSGFTPLYWACRFGKEDIVKLLLSHDLAIQTINRAIHLGYTPMGIAEPKIKALLQQALDQRSLHQR